MGQNCHGFDLICWQPCPRNHILSLLAVDRLCAPSGAVLGRISTVCIRTLMGRRRKQSGAKGCSSASRHTHSCARQVFESTVRRHSAVALNSHVAHGWDRPRSPQPQELQLIDAKLSVNSSDSTLNLVLSGATTTSVDR
jgi:hypothetical protein